MQDGVYMELVLMLPRLRLREVATRSSYDGSIDASLTWALGYSSTCEGDSELKRTRLEVVGTWQSVKRETKPYGNCSNVLTREGGGKANERTSRKSVGSPFFDFKWQAAVICRSRYVRNKSASFAGSLCDCTD